MNGPGCHYYRHEFSGRAIPASNLDIVMVSLNASDKGFTIRRDAIHAWGTFVERLILVEDGEPASKCPRCGENNDPIGYSYELRPMVADDRCALVDALDDDNQWEVVAICTRGELPDSSLVAEAVTRLKGK